MICHPFRLSGKEVEETLSRFLVLGLTSLYKMINRGGTVRADESISMPNTGPVVGIKRPNGNLCFLSFGVGVEVGKSVKVD
jgi:hypothetical protein